MQGSSWRQGHHPAALIPLRSSRSYAPTDELKRVKATIAEKKAQQTTAKESSERISEIMEALERLKHEPITLDNQALRKLIECIRVLSKGEIQIIFKGGFERNVPLK